MLRIGLLDPRSTTVGDAASLFSREPCTPARVIEVATSTSLWGGAGTSPVCPKTLALARRVLKPWSPTNHDLCAGLARCRLNIDRENAELIL